MANLVIGIVALPETLTVENRRPFCLRRANPVASLATVSRLPGLLPLVMGFALMQLAVQVYPAVWAFYAQANFEWTAAMIGGSLAFYGVSAAIAQAVVAPALLSRTGEVRTIRIGMAIGIVCLVGYGLSGNAAFVLLLVPFSALMASAGA